MNRRTKTVLKVVGAVGFAAVSLLVGSVGYLYITHRTLNPTLATNINVSDEWTEISPETPLQNRRIAGEVVIALPNYRAERGGGDFEIKLPDGRVVHPQIELIDGSGNVLELTHSGFTYTGDRDLVVFTPKGGFPSAEYKTLRIRSDQPFTLERLFWRERDPK